LPVIEKSNQNILRTKLFTFFLPFNFEVRKKQYIADATVYLPLDTKKAQKFLRIVHPEMAFL
jgi:3-deoxy-D-manno-octulosonic-acid transferase